ncbi:alpha,alpha-trehalose-phosphate synthase (UDP-forming) [Enterovirga sp.]|uniref:alpha,alpha-trehalose-phosphate synthase (UDP-forming) n=1 Tax=Enterovirga sp. TaxID=2026350 RepID=UPI00261334D1|nr:alpha,alpha-trehalose-phosphate synthase (UDP-forming) [Enterovirga sp.]
MKETLDQHGGGGRSRLVVVSNRVPAPNPRGPAGAGGLAVALEAALKAHGGIWFGWSGEARPAIDAEALKRQTVGPITFATTDLTKRDVEDYYLGYSNRALWPVCHYRLDLARFDERQTQAYFRVNEFFARKLANLVETNDVVWIHDYHMMPLGAALRARGLRNRIGFFLHIPWPPAEVASALPGYSRLMRSMAAYDLIGFQTPRDAEHFGQCLVEEGLAIPLGDGWYDSGERRFQITSFPIGIDTDAIRIAAATSVGQVATRRMLASLEGKRLVIGVDRLDYSKGLRERIRAFVTFLTQHPEARGHVTYLQVTPKSRSEVPEYRRIEQEVATQVGEANGACGEFDWTPIRYLNQNIPHSTLTGLYRTADVGLVTPLRDGMNLVAKEYVASQDETDPGVLVLSRYAGAACELDAALLVNPYDAVGTAAAVARALDMPLGERRERWRSMMDVLERHTVNDWWRGFLNALQTAPAPAAGVTDGQVGATG